MVFMQRAIYSDRGRIQNRQSCIRAIRTAHVYMQIINDIIVVNQMQASGPFI